MFPAAAPSAFLGLQLSTPLPPEEIPAEASAANATREVLIRVSGDIEHVVASFGHGLSTELFLDVVLYVLEDPLENDLALFQFGERLLKVELGGFELPTSLGTVGLRLRLSFDPYVEGLQELDDQALKLGELVDQGVTRTVVPLRHLISLKVGISQPIELLFDSQLKGLEKGQKFNLEMALTLFG